MHTVLKLAAGIMLVGALASQAQAQPLSLNASDYRGPALVGAVGGTTVGILASQGVLIGATSATLATVTGGVGGVAAVALVDASFQPCRGFQALFNVNRLRGITCRNGTAVGY